MKKQFAKILKIFLAFVLGFGVMPKGIYAEENAEDYKFIVEVSSEDSTGKKNAVTATVYPDYRAELVIDEGNVNKSNVTVELWMKNVASLGVDGERRYERTIQTGMTPGDVSLDTVVGLFSGLKNGTVIGKVDDKSVTYTLTNEGRVINGTPDSTANASSVWHGIVNSENVTAGTQAEDSYIIIPKGSYLQVADQILTVDQELKIDNLGDIAKVIQDVRDAVTMQAAEKAIEAIEIYVEPGAQLSVGSSYVKLNEDRDAKITIDIAGYEESGFIASLTQMKNAGSVEEMIKAVFAAISSVTTEMNSRTTTVEFTFGHVYGEPTYEWAEDNSTVTAKAVCENNPEHVLEETVNTVMTEGDGKVVYTATFENEVFETQKKEIQKDKDYKFIVKVSSEDSTGKKNAVTATVYPDYRAELVIDEGNVNKSNVTVELWMKNVASLGVDGERRYERTIQTGMTPGDVSLDTVVGLFSGLKNGTVIGKVDDKSVTYTLTNEGRVINGTPDSTANASSVWHGIVNSENVTAGTQAEDSYIIIPKGSYLQVADQILTVDQELKIDNLGDIAKVIQDVRDAVTMQAAEKAIEAIEIYVEPGAQLSVGSSYVKLNEDRDAKITIDIAGYEESGFIASLTQMKNAGSVEEMIKAVFAAISSVTTEMNSRTTTVEFTFGHVYGEPTYEWAEDNSTVTAKAVCENNPEHVLEETVKTTVEETPAGCETEGKKVYTAEFENELFETQTKEETIPATGHKYGEPTYEWAEDNSTVTAKAVCENDPEHVIEETAKTTVEETPAGCETDGKKVYTAEFENELFETQTKEETIPATGHKYGEPTYEWAEDNSTVTAKAVCETDPKHVLEETVKTTVEETPAGCETEGKKVYTAEFENELFKTQTKEETIEALGHDWGEWVVLKEPTKTEPGLRQRTCKRCGEVEIEEIPETGSVPVTSVELNKTEMTMQVGDEETLIAAVLPENADDKSVTWTSNDPSVATVNENGKVTAVADLGIADPSTAVIVVTTKDGGYVASCTVTVEDPINAFVRRLYKLCLNRKADQSGFKNWTNLLRTKQRTAAQVVQGFFNSKEMTNMGLSDEEWVERCYLTMMDRASDANGKAYWVERRGNVVSNNYILKGFVEGKEFAEICSRYGITAGTIKLTEWRDQNYGVTKFVARCYKEVLNRKADVSGLNNWCKKILTASSRKQAAIDTASAGFFHSAEFGKRNTTNEQYVTILYRTFLGREPDPSGYKDWVGRLKAGTSRDVVMKGFANSTEFAKIIKEYGIE